MYIIIGVFLVGFIFALIMSSYYKIRQEKIAEINKKFQGLKGDYELVQNNLEKYIKWKYRVKIIEKVYYILLLILGFLFYRSPSLLTKFFVDYGHLTIPCFCFMFLFF